VNFGDYRAWTETAKGDEPIGVEKSVRELSV
jgi:hypothetical protein